MSRYILTRILAMLPTLIGLTAIIFFMMRVIPGDIATVMLAESPTAQHKEEIRRTLGLDEPLYRQYLRWIGGLLRGELGTSFWTNRPVTSEILKAAPVTVELSIMSAAVAVATGVPIGVVSAIRRNTALDYLTRSFSVILLSLPTFWLATLAVLLPAIWFGWAPPVEYRMIWEDISQNIVQSLAPAVVIGLHSAATIARMTRSAMLDVLRQDFVRTARAKGLTDVAVIVRHALRNALIPVVTIIGSLVASLLTGAIVSETVFNLPGFGLLLVSAIGQRDYPLIQGCVLAFGVIYSVVNLTVDLCYTVIDPRIRYG